MSYEEQFESLQATTNAIVQRYQPDIQALQQEGNQIASDGKQSFKFDLQVTWGEQLIAFDIPQFEMHTQTFSLDVPQVTMHDQAYTFSTPSVRMVSKKIGQYPEFHGTKIVWSDIIIDVPEVFMEEQRIVVGIPEFRMDTTSFSIDIPEVRMDRVEWKLRVPEVRLGDVSLLIPIDNTDMKQRAEALQQRGQELQRRMHEEIQAAVTTAQSSVSAPATQKYSEAVQGSSETTQRALKAFDDALAAIDQALSHTQIPAELRTQLLAQREDLVTKRASALTQLTTPLDQHMQSTTSLFNASYASA